MKKILLTLALVVGFAGSSVDMYAQNGTSWKAGLTYVATPQYTGPSGDTLIYRGTLTLIGPTGVRLDSLAVRISNEDSLRQALVLRIKNGFGAYTDSASVVHLGGDLIYDATAAGAAHYPWFLLRAALGDKISTAQAVEIWTRVHKVGTELPGSAKKTKIQATRFD